MAGELARQGLQEALAVGDTALARKIGSDIQLYDPVLGRGQLILDELTDIILN